MLAIVLRAKMPLALAIQQITLETWPLFQDSSGRIFDEYSARKWTFYKGISPAVRSEVWKFLLGYYSFASTHEERERVDKEKSEIVLRVCDCKHLDTRLKYEELMSVWSSSSFISDEAFRNYDKVIEKDIWRTDRHLEFYTETTVKKLQVILRTFIIYNPQMGYIQGMNDILSPLLMLMENEHQIFWCFTEVMKRMSPILSDLSLSLPLHNLSRLCWYTDKQLYDHIVSIYEDEDWIFCYRWILLCFKREFSLEQIYQLWECIWSNHATSHFLLFVTMAVLIHFRRELLQCLTPEDFMQLSCKASGTIPLSPTLCTARVLLQQLKSDEYLPHELRYLVSADGCAPPPLVGFVRARQRFSTLHSNKLTSQRSQILENLFGEGSVQPITSPFMLSHGKEEECSASVNIAISHPPKAGFVPREKGIGFREDIRRLQYHAESPERAERQLLLQNHIHPCYPSLPDCHQEPNGRPTATAVDNTLWNMWDPSTVADSLQSQQHRSRAGAVWQGCGQSEAGSQQSSDHEVSDFDCLRSEAELVTV